MAQVKTYGSKLMVIYDISYTLY